MKRTVDRFQRVPGPMGWLIALLVLLFTTIPSIVYGICAWIFVPIGLFLRLFGRSFALRTYPWLLSKLILPIFLIIVVPSILYFYVWEPLCWIFFAWMIIYFIGRRWSGISDLETGMLQEWSKDGNKKRRSSTERTSAGWAASGHEARTEEEKSCPGCGCKLPRNAEFCRECGARMEDYIARSETRTEKETFCLSCGARLQKNAKYCDQCNLRI